VRSASCRQLANGVLVLFSTQETKKGNTMTTIPHRLFAIALIMAVGLIANQAQAGLITSETGDSSDTGFTLATSGVLDGTVSVNGTIEPNWSTDVQLLNNQSLGAPQSTSTITDANAIWGGASITIAFDTSVNKKGYDITGIQSYAGWDTGANGRSNQGYQIDITFVGGKTATLLAKQSWANTDPVSYWTQVVIANESGTGVLSNGSGVVATGVESVTFSNTDDAAAVGPVAYREFQIIGAATTIPEPNTIMMVVTGMIGLLAYAWRKRK